MFTIFQSCKKQWQEQQKQQVKKDMEICRKLLREEKEERKQKEEKEEKERKQKEEKEQELSLKLDRVIRNSKNFNGMFPLECALDIKDLPYIQADLFFIANNERFKVSKNTISLKYLTPMQVPDRLFGTYRCKKCKKNWSSGYSWSNKWQQCNKCNSKIYPFYQQKLKRSKKISEQSHDSNRCEKCREIGRCNLNPQTKSTKFSEYSIWI